MNLSNNFFSNPTMPEEEMAESVMLYYLNKDYLKSRDNYSYKVELKKYVEDDEKAIKKEIIIKGKLERFNFIEKYISKTN